MIDTDNGFHYLMAYVSNAHFFNPCHFCPEKGCDVGISFQPSGSHILRTKRLKSKKILSILLIMLCYYDTVLNLFGHFCATNILSIVIATTLEF